MDELRWGVLGATAFISTRVSPALHRAEGNRVVAMAGRSGRLDVVSALAAEFGARAHDGFDALLADPDVDAVYITLPNSLHVPWTVRALEAGKHVLVEKPMALTEADCDLVDAAAGSRTVMEAFWYRFHPQQERVAEIIASGEIGSPRLVRASFAFVAPDGADIRFDPALGGGATWDVGCYAFDVAMWLFGREPLSVRALEHRRAGAVVDTSVVSTMDFGGGRIAVLDYSLDHGPRSGYEVQGTLGTIVVHDAWARDADDARLTVLGPDGARDEVLPAVDAYERQALGFAEAVRTGAQPRITAAESRRNARVGSALLRSGATGRDVVL
ncbi:Gfo/Idh/MocA family oxidoreductase [Actinosynnema sp. NPDC020468]|uniref:Gfo/Idh/MocA family protein n=1 Tax=Actinosynnema sp. NPDC020468 TaxID=3154488 RepID=UPI0033E2FB41